MIIYLTAAVGAVALLAGSVLLTHDGGYPVTMVKL